MIQISTTLSRAFLLHIFLELYYNVNCESCNYYPYWPFSDKTLTVSGCDYCCSIYPRPTSANRACCMKFSWAAILGIVLGTVALMAIVAFVVFFCGFRKRRARQNLARAQVIVPPPAPQFVASNPSLNIYPSKISSELNVSDLPPPTYSEVALKNTSDDQKEKEVKPSSAKEVS